MVGPQVYVGPGARISTEYSYIYIYIYIYAIKIFYETMKYKKMNDGIFKFLCLYSKYFFKGFLCS